MFTEQKLKSASFLFRHAFPLYRRLYFRFKNKKDKNNLQIISKIIKPGYNILDIGANIGFYTSFFSGCTGGSGHVYAFEPDKTNFRHLKKIISAKKNVTVMQKAIAAETGTLTLYTSTLLNVDHRTYEPDNYDGKYTVDKISVDDFVKGNFKIDFIKMDIQGFEMDALKGMQKTLSANQNVILFTELWPYGLQKAGSSPLEVFDFLSANGFKIYNLDMNKLMPMTQKEAANIKVGFLYDVNILASRNELTNQLN